MLENSCFLRNVVARSQPSSARGGGGMEGGVFRLPAAMPPRCACPPQPAQKCTYGAGAFALCKSPTVVIWPPRGPIGIITCSPTRRRQLAQKSRPPAPRSLLGAASPPTYRLTTNTNKNKLATTRTRSSRSACRSRARSRPAARRSEFAGLFVMMPASRGQRSNF